jgi:hypothetical protein
MKKTVAILFLLVLSLSLAHGQKSRYGQPPPIAAPGTDFPIHVHISGIHFFTQCYGRNDCVDVFRIDALLDGKKVELSGDLGMPSKQHRAEIVPGSNLQARLWKDSHKIEGTPMFQVYELVWPDRTVWLCTVTGISE